MSHLAPGPSTNRPRRPNTLPEWTSRLPIQRDTFEKLTSMRYFFYSTQFLRSEVPLTIWNVVLLGQRKKSIREASHMDIQAGIWYLFRCCVEVYDEYKIGLIGSGAFWIMVWSRLQRLRKLDADDFTIYKYLPHIVHFYAKSRELDAWNRRAFFQTYWDPHTGVSNQLPRRQGLVVDDEDWYQNHEDNEKRLQDRETRKVSSDWEVWDFGPEKPNDDNDDIQRENLALVETFEENAVYINHGADTDSGGNFVMVSKDETDPCEASENKSHQSHDSPEGETRQDSAKSYEKGTTSEVDTPMKTGSSDSKPESIIFPSSTFKNNKRKGGPVLILRRVKDAVFGKN
ncbi:hypothetical protein F5Y02DRAFT_429472 [Annulohypoxylon stygium]|nr:hypothetical protein F5Y02DRAFT_429472 [Annulohypoxylon stygium]